VIPLAVTVTSMASPPHVMIARERAAAWGLPWLERPRNSSLEPLLAHATALLIFGGDGLTLRDAFGTLRFSPGMAQLRIKRLDAGFEEDMLLRLGELRGGDRLLDCTFGLGADALVSARAVGVAGRVVAIEKSLPLYALAAQELEAPWAEGFAKIDVRHGDSAEQLAQLPAKSFDVVLFDPMFGRPNKSSNAFAMLRRYADDAPLTAEMLADARRVARRWVVIKGSRYSKDFKKLGLVAEPRSLSRGVLWARLPGA
jgi:16S rRNA (guanine1516-N2)-methyltransferase